MKTVLLVLFALALTTSTFGQDYELEEKPVIRTRQARGPSLPRNLPRQNLLSKTTTTTTEAPLEDEEYTDEELQEGDLVEEEPHTTTTEAPKKPFRGVVRPFRSNDQLIEALKRRRAQMSGGRQAGNYPSTTTTTTEQYATERQSKPRAGKSNGRFSPRANQPNPRTTEVPTTSEEPRQRFSARGGRRF